MCSTSMVTTGGNMVNSAVTANGNARVAQSKGRLDLIQAQSQSNNRASQARMQATSMELNAILADINARGAEADARTAIMAGQREVQKLQLDTANLKSRQRVGLAANGVDLGEGSALNILTTTDVMGEIDANTLEANATRAAWGYRTKKAGYIAESIMATASADATRSQANLQQGFDRVRLASDRQIVDAISPNKAIFTSLLAGAGDFYKAYSGYQKDNDVAQANKTSDPIYSLGSKRKWWGTA